MSDDIQRQLDDIKARLSALEGERWSGPPRLGPQPGAAGFDLSGIELADAAKEQIAVADTVDKGPALCTTNGKPVDEVRAAQTNATGQHDGYIVLCESERQKGFVRPYRDAYRHVGEEIQLETDDGRPSHRVRSGACGTVTTMGRALSETYARDPKFYGATFCVTCNAHFPVDQFVWTADGARVGS